MQHKRGCPTFAKLRWVRPVNDKLSEGHSLSCADKRPTRRGALATEVCFSQDKVKRRTSAAKAACFVRHIGTAKAVPFRFLQPHISGAPYIALFAMCGFPIPFTRNSPREWGTQYLPMTGERCHAA